jgi:dCTP deaminase
MKRRLFVFFVGLRKYCIEKVKQTGIIVILVDRHIEREMTKGNLIIDPFNKKNLGPNSYDMTLAPTCKIYHPHAIKGQPMTDDKFREWIDFKDRVGYGEKFELDCRKDNPVFEFEIQEEGFVLQPNHLYLYSCAETIGVGGDICATVMGKSSLGRLGLDIHVCAGFIDTGFGIDKRSSLVLEMRTIYPLRIYPGMKICQIKFEQTTGEPDEAYNKKVGSKYNGQIGVQESKYFHNFDLVDQSDVDHVIPSSKL